MKAMRGRGGFPRSGPPAGEDAAREKATRSIFGENSFFKNAHSTLFKYAFVILYCYSTLSLVANIAFETTEEQLRPILCEVGPVVSLK